MPLQHHVLQVVQEWSVSLLVWLCVGIYEWCVRQVEPSTHSLLATQLPGHGGAGPLLRSRLAVKRNIRGAQREWRKDGAKCAPGLDSVLRQACSTHLMTVRQTFAQAFVLEQCRRHQPGLDPESRLALTASGGARTVHSPLPGLSNVSAAFACAHTPWLVPLYTVRQTRLSWR